MISFGIVAFIRPMTTYEGMDKLISAIASQVRVEDTALDQERFNVFQDDDSFFFVQ